MSGARAAAAVIASVCLGGLLFGSFRPLWPPRTETPVAITEPCAAAAAATAALEKQLVKAKQSQAALEKQLLQAQATSVTTETGCTSLASTVTSFVNARNEYSSVMAPEEVSGHGVIAASCKPQWNYVFSYPKYDNRGPGWLQNAFDTVSKGVQAPLCGYDWDDSIHNAFPKGHCGLVVDVGANTGLAVAPAASLGWRVLAFEPIPNNVEQLRINLFLNGWTMDTVGLVHAGVSDVTGNATIYAPAGREDNTAMSSAAATKNVGGSPVEFQIKLVSLDDYFAGASQNLADDIRLIKVDTQGHELLVLRGARRLLSTGPRKFLFFVELDYGLQRAAGHDPRDIPAFMESLGWKASCDAAGLVPYKPQYEGGEGVSRGSCYDVIFRFDQKKRRFLAAAMTTTTTVQMKKAGETQVLASTEEDQQKTKDVQAGEAQVLASTEEDQQKTKDVQVTN